MSWIVFSFLAALSRSLTDVFSKKGLKSIDTYVVSWSSGFFALPRLLPLLFFDDIPPIGEWFWLALFVSGSLNIVAIILYMKAIQCSDLSVSVPMTAFSPLFLLILSPVIVGEFPSFLGLFGVTLIVLGSYVLNIRLRREGYLAPFKALFKETGPKLMLSVAFIWSVTSAFDKIGIRNSSPIFWVVMVNVFIVLAMLPFVLYKSERLFVNIRANYKVLFPVGLFGALTITFQAIAMSMALVAYVISIKRTSSVMSVAFGHFIFGEKNAKERLIGAAIMLLGVFLIAMT